MIDKTKTLIDLEDKTPRIIKCDGTEVPFPPKNGTAYDFRELQEALRMEGNPEPLFTIAGKINGMMMLAEDNAIAYELPHNLKATWFYNEMAMRNGHPNPEWPILGNVIIFPEEMME